MGGGAGGIGRRGNLGAVDEQPSEAGAAWDNFPALIDFPLITSDGVNRQLYQVLGANGLSTAVATVNMTGNLALAMPFVVGAKRTLTRVGLYTVDGHTADSQAVQAAIYTNKEDGYYPDEQVWFSGSKPGVGVGGSGTTLIVMGSGLTVSMPAGLYWAVVQVNGQWQTDGRTLESFKVPRWSPGYFVQTAAGNANTPGLSGSQLLGWQKDVGSFTLPSTFPSGADPIFNTQEVPAILATWGPG